VSVVTSRLMGRRSMAATPTPGVELKLADKRVGRLTSIVRGQRAGQNVAPSSPTPPRRGRRAAPSWSREGRPSSTRAMGDARLDDVAATCTPHGTLMRSVLT
jgi:hypothetical protein